MQGAPIPVLKGAPCEEVHVTILHQRRGEAGHRTPSLEGSWPGWLAAGFRSCPEDLSPGLPRTAPRLLRPQLGDHTAQGRPPGCDIKEHSRPASSGGSLHGRPLEVTGTDQVSLAEVLTLQKLVPGGHCPNTMPEMSKDSSKVLNPAPSPSRL